MFGKLFGWKDESQFEAEVRVADTAFRDSVLLMKLLEAAGTTEAAKSMLAVTSTKWRQSSDARLRTTGISLLRFLFKAMHVGYSKPLFDEVLGLFTSSSSLAARLAALDVLGAMSATPNPTQLLSQGELERLIAFRTQLMQQMNAAQRQYATSGVAADLAREISKSNGSNALAATVERLSKTGSTQ